MKSAGWHHGLSEAPASPGADSTLAGFVRRSQAGIPQEVPQDLLQFLKYKNSQTGQTFPTVSAPKGFGHKNLLPLVLKGRGRSLRPFVLALEFSWFSSSCSALKPHSKEFYLLHPPRSSSQRGDGNRNALSASDVPAEMQWSLWKSSIAPGLWSGASQGREVAEGHLSPDLSMALKL